MIHMMQVIGYMLNTLEYSRSEVVEHFEALERGEIDANELMDVVGLSFRSQAQMDRFEAAMPKWRSALAVSEMQSTSEAA